MLLGVGGAWAGGGHNISFVTATSVKGKKKCTCQASSPHVGRGEARFAVSSRDGRDGQTISQVTSNMPCSQGAVPGCAVQVTYRGSAEERADLPRFNQQFGGDVFDTAMLCHAVLRR